MLRVMAAQIAIPETRCRVGFLADRRDDYAAAAAAG